MEIGAPLIIGGSVDLRASGGGRGRRISGKFPYRARATISDGGRNGRPRKEQFAPRAFRYSINDPDRDIRLLVGHDYEKPLASQSTGSLILRDDDDALFFDANIAPEIVETSYFRDFWGGFLAGLVIGLSPGFRIPPPSAVAPEDAEKVEEEDPDEGNALIRTIFQAILYEISLVTSPDYPSTEVEARDAARAAALVEARQRALVAARRWRA